METIYVTFQIKPTAYCMSLGYEAKHYAIKCSSMDNAREAASDVSSIDGVSHLYINKCGRLKHKDTKVIMFGSYYEGEL